MKVLKIKNVQLLLVKKKCRNINYSTYNQEPKFKKKLFYNPFSDQMQSFVAIDDNVI